MSSGDASVSPTDAAKEIDKLFPLNRASRDDRKNEEPESFLFEMWGVVISVAEQILWKHPGQTRLVEVVQALKDFPGPTTIEMEGWGKLAVWSDLPLLGPVMTERGYAIDLGDASDAQEAIRTRQRNFVAFAARLTQSGLVDRSKHFSIQDFRAAFEEEPDQRSKAYLKQGPRLDVYVPLAGIWILLCGNVIFAHCRNPGTPLADFKDAGKDWKGANGFSIERWNFWKKKFGEVKAHDQACEKTKGLAARAEEVMHRIEGEAT
ncbi:hypothetical protein BDZ97DRAFT_1913447 [Flammula alnicola]|nr:hypothetical protein BDZ97DRAFT_1913447 [Flammula alnicola]